MGFIGRGLGRTSITRGKRLGLPCLAILAVCLSMPVIEYALLAWTVPLDLVADRLPALGESPDPSPATTAAPLPSLTIFKPLPPTTADADRLLLDGCHRILYRAAGREFAEACRVEQVEGGRWEPVFQRWRRGPAVARILIRTLPPPLPEANPKIAKLEALAPMALGQFWLWSDADIIAPPGLLKQLQRELADSGAGGVTSAYAVRSPARAAGMLDAFFVNLEFLPGALLLGRPRSAGFRVRRRTPCFARRTSTPMSRGASCAGPWPMTTSWGSVGLSA